MSERFNPTDENIKRALQANAERQHFHDGAGTNRGLKHCGRDMELSDSFHDGYEYDCMNCGYKLRTRDVTFDSSVDHGVSKLHCFVCNGECNPSKHKFECPVCYGVAGQNRDNYCNRCASERRVREDPNYDLGVSKHDNGWIVHCASDSRKACGYISDSYPDNHSAYQAALEHKLDCPKGGQDTAVYPDWYSRDPRYMRVVKVDPSPNCSQCGKPFNPYRSADYHRQIPESIRNWNFSTDGHEAREWCVDCLNDRHRDARLENKTPSVYRYDDVDHGVRKIEGDGGDDPRTKNRRSFYDVGNPDDSIRWDQDASSFDRQFEGLPTRPPAQDDEAGWQQRSKDFATVRDSFLNWAPDPHESTGDWTTDIPRAWDKQSQDAYHYMHMLSQGNPCLKPAVKHVHSNFENYAASDVLETVVDHMRDHKDCPAMGTVHQYHPKLGSSLGVSKSRHAGRYQPDKDDSHTWTPYDHTSKPLHDVWHVTSAYNVEGIRQHGLRDKFDPSGLAESQDSDFPYKRVYFSTDPEQSRSIAAQVNDLADDIGEPDARAAVLHYRFPAHVLAEHDARHDPEMPAEDVNIGLRPSSKLNQYLCCVSDKPETHSSVSKVIEPGLTGIEPDDANNPPPPAVVGSNDRSTREDGIQDFSSPYSSLNKVLNGRGQCPYCTKHMNLNSSGTFPHHRGRGDEDPCRGWKKKCNTALRESEATIAKLIDDLDVTSSSVDVLLNKIYHDVEKGFQGRKPSCKSCNQKLNRLDQHAWTCTTEGCEKAGARVGVSAASRRAYQERKKTVPKTTELSVPKAQSDRHLYGRMAAGEPSEGATPDEAPPGRVYALVDGSRGSSRGLRHGFSPLGDPSEGATFYHSTEHLPQGQSDHGVGVIEVDSGKIPDMFHQGGGRWTTELDKVPPEAVTGFQMLRAVRGGRPFTPLGKALDAMISDYLQKLDDDEDIDDEDRFVDSVAPGQRSRMRDRYPTGDTYPIPREGEPQGFDILDVDEGPAEYSYGHVSFYPKDFSLEHEFGDNEETSKVMSGDVSGQAKWNRTNRPSDVYATGLPHLKRVFGLPHNSAQWDQMSGCQSCPCSPGFKLQGHKKDYYVTYGPKGVKSEHGMPSAVPCKGKEEDGSPCDRRIWGQFPREYCHACTHKQKQEAGKVRVDPTVDTGVKKRFESSGTMSVDILSSRLDRLLE
jgi:hypothetical protein